MGMSAYILVVDDNEVHCYAMAKTLAAAGYETACAHSGSDALALLSGLGIDLVLLDINLPDMSGIEVCRRIRANKKTAGTPVVFHTATYASDDWRRRAESVGATDFLTYPVNQQQLLMVLDGALSRSKRRRA